MTESVRRDLPDCPPRFDTSLVRPYWDALARGDFVLPACSICGAWQWYPYEFVKCHAGAQHVWKPAPQTGTVFTFAEVHRWFLPNAPDDAPPYVAALVELDGIGGLRIPTCLVNLAGRRPAIGMRVRLLPVQRTGYTAPMFEPAE
ncbi:MAG: OB-fold domain-containing protein [Steroidobacteraceae bacterium]|nr:OB-fold domain-containing protein [Steroidobacteraceae bacterium]MDW8260296.1 OB-fold domain-containing protein [Gammaproteobacteria bacterium]